MRPAGPGEGHPGEGEGGVLQVMLPCSCSAHPPAPPEAPAVPPQARLRGSTTTLPTLVPWTARMIANDKGSGMELFCVCADLPPAVAAVSSRLVYIR